jgi:hypothetical protein
LCISATEVLGYRSRAQEGPEMQTSGPQRNRRLEYCWLLDVEQLLNEQLGLLGGASYPQRLEIEAELSEIRREVARLRSRTF